MGPDWDLAATVLKRLKLASAAAEVRPPRAAGTQAQVRFCRCRFSATGDLGYRGIRGAVGLGYRFTGIPLLLILRLYC
jgi:hypothetical protein